MSIATEITRMTGLRNRIRAKLISLGVLNNTDADLASCTDALESITGTSGQLVYGCVTGTSNDGRLIIPIEADLLYRMKTLYIETHMANPTTNMIITVYVLSFGTDSLYCVVHFYADGYRLEELSLDYNIYDDGLGNYYLVIEDFLISVNATHDCLFIGQYMVFYTYTPGLVTTERQQIMDNS